MIVVAWLVASICATFHALVFSRHLCEQYKLLLTIVTAVACVGSTATPLVSDDCVGVYTERLIFMNLVSTRSHGVRFINGAVYMCFAPLLYYS